MRRSMIGIGSMALLGAISFAPVFAQQGGGQQGQQGQGQGQRQGQGYGTERQGQQGQQGGMDRQGQQGGMDRQGQWGQADKTGQTGQLRVGQQPPALNLFDLKGQVFVLEFINPTDEKWTKLHESGQLKQTYERYKEQGIVWLAICPFQSTTGGQAGMGQQGQQGGMGQQGQQPGMRQGQAGQAGEIQGIAKVDRNQLVQTVRRLDLDFPVLYDEGGKIVKQFGITAIPHVLIVDAEGKVAYAAPIAGQGGQVAGSNEFERALGQAVQTQQSGSLPAGSPRQGQGMDRQGQQPQQGTTGDQDKEKKERERIERERNQNLPR